MPDHGATIMKRSRPRHFFAEEHEGDENDGLVDSGTPSCLPVPSWLAYRTAITPMTLFSNSLSFALMTSGRVR
jgi:hypothetical protein